MIYSILAGVLNGTATYLLKQSNKYPFLVIASILLYGLNFYFFRIAISKINVSYAYCVLVLSTLSFIKIFELLLLKKSLTLIDLSGYSLVLLAVLLLSK